MYEAILFDFDNTLVDLHACEATALREAFTRAGLLTDSEVSWAKIWGTYRPIGAYFWNRCGEDGLSRDQVIEYSIRDTLAALGEEPSLTSTIAGEHWSIFCQTDSLNPGALEIVERLSGHYKLGLVTNGYSEAQRGRLRASGLENYFSSVVISDEAGCAKPSPQIFEIALSELEVSSGEALYVGDSIEHDYYGAMNASIDFCYYRPDKSKRSAEIYPTFEIRDLQDLGRILLSG